MHGTISVHPTATQICLLYNQLHKLGRVASRFFSLHSQDFVTCQFYARGSLLMGSPDALSLLTQQLKLDARS